MSSFFRGLKEAWHGAQVLVRSRRAARAVPTPAAIKAKQAIKPATAGGRAAVDLSNLSPAELQARVDQLRASLIVSQQQAYQEQLNRVHEAATAASTEAKKAARNASSDEELRAIADFQKRLDSMEVDRETYIREVTSSALASLESEPTFNATSTFTAAAATPQTDAPDADATTAGEPAATPDAPAVERPLAPAADFADDFERLMKK